MKLLTITIFIFLVILSIYGFATMSDLNKECMQRGYEIYLDPELKGTYCVFPDGNKCQIEEFNKGLCGSEYKTTNYCVKRGDFVWDKDKCCLGLKPYLAPYLAGHPACQPFYFSIIFNPYLLIGILLVVGILIYWKIKK